MDRQASPPTTTIGAVPGTLVIPPGAVDSHITVIRYSEDRHDRHDRVKPEALRKLIGGGFDVVWVDVSGSGTVEVFETLIKKFGVPWLSVEDHLSGAQRPKVEPYGDARFILLRAIQVPGTVEMDQISIFLSGHVVFTMQHRHGDCFDAIRKRVADPTSQARKRGADYLAYRIADAMVDSFFPEMERLMSGLEKLEETAIRRPNAKLLRDLHGFKSEIRISSGRSCRPATRSAA